MHSLIVALITLAFLCAGMLAGWLLRKVLPENHLSNDSRDLVKMASGMIATLVALVIGLLVSSSKSSFDQASSGLTQASARLIALDRTLARYGPDAAPIRARLRQGIAAIIERLWPSAGRPREGMAAVEKSTGLDEVQESIRQLAPGDEAHRSIQSQALQICGDLTQSRWLMVEQAQTALPTVFLVMLISWLTVLFTSFGLLAPRNVTTFVCLLVCAVSMAGAIFLMLEMNRPFEGTIQVSPAPLQKALSLIGH
jgi:hypothetical protein